jgi:crossover junction endodeoxyribonuclease RusA
MTAAPAAALVLTLPWPPALNHYYRYVGPRVLISRTGRDYKERAALAAAVAGVRPLAGPLAVDLYLYRPRKAGDVDAYAKCLLDAMQGHLWGDDKQIVELHLYRRDDKVNPRVEVRVWPVTYA